MQATAQRYHELHPDIEIRWEKRSLQAFADESIADLSSRFDLLVIDHPFTGEAANHGLFLPYDELPTGFLDDQAAHSVGKSHVSYQMNGKQWALAIDAATPVAGWREDLLDKAGEQVPQTWEELLRLAKRGMVEFCGWPCDCLMYFYTMCINEGEAPFGADKSQLISDTVGMRVLDALKTLAGSCDPAGFGRNPIQSWEYLTSQDKVAYCPMAYGYSNYARPGFARKPLRFGGLVSRNGKRLTSTLGGTGLAISAMTKLAAEAMSYAQFCASPEIQRQLFAQAGGQPGHRTAWLDGENNRQSRYFFRDTLSTLDAAYLRPRFDQYIDFQNKGAVLIANALKGVAAPKETLASLNALYRIYPAR